MLFVLDFRIRSVMLRDAMKNEIIINNVGILEQQVMFGIDTAYAAIVTKKDDKHQYINYQELQSICHTIKNYFISHVGEPVKEVDGACELALAILAPDAVTRANHVKDAYSFIGGLAGVGAIITGIGLALGWGAGVIAAVTAFFVGSSVTGPLALVLVGLAAVGVAAYFAYSNDTEIELSNKAMKVLKEGIKGAMPAIWKKYGDKFSK